MSMITTLDRLPAKPWFSTRPDKYAKARTKTVLSVLGPEIVRMGDWCDVPPAWDLAHHSVAFVYCRAGLWLHGAPRNYYMRVPYRALASEQVDVGDVTTPLTHRFAERIGSAIGPDEPYVLVVTPDGKASEFLVATSIVSRDVAVFAELIVALGCGGTEVRAPGEVFEALYGKFGRGPGDSRSRQMFGGIAASRSVLHAAQRLYEEERRLIPLFKQAGREVPDEIGAA